MTCTNCETLKSQIEHLDLMIATLEQENRQQHARNVRLQEELTHAERIIGEYREAAVVMPMSYNQIRESFSK